MTRAAQAVKLLTRIRMEKPELWRQIQEFSIQERLKYDMESDPPFPDPPTSETEKGVLALRSNS